MKNLLLIAAAAATLAPFASQAESNFVTTTGSTTPAASAKLDFKIVVPKVLFLQVGTGTSMADNGTVDMVQFDVPGASIGNGTKVTGTNGGTPGSVTVRVLGNIGALSLTNATTGPLTSIAGNTTIPWSDISVTAAALATPTPGYTAGFIDHPTFNDTSGTSLAATNGVVRREGSWTFQYANTSVVPAGTYGDTAAKNGRVTYTATAP
ncbi:hypothetical protein J2X90_004508 [Variovorax paradoxus]|uniref:hypothetical protein n=1 Tax=Variovorax paradoxus TaxID=34073 RepID=UPI0027888782|nr:hypothetical protein [Variovorax paradoxus]MDQ0026681.1 hypothetical protein [Variovorax paradoxus]